MASGRVEEATRRAGWERKLLKGRGLGLAVAHSFMSYVAAVNAPAGNPERATPWPRQSELSFPATRMWSAAAGFGYMVATRPQKPKGAIFWIAPFGFILVPER